jgi:predicted aspartyl protease
MSKISVDSEKDRDGGRVRVILSLLVVLLLSTPLVAEPKGDVKSKTSASLKFDYVSQSLIVIPVYVNGNGPYRFLLDTGAGMTVLSNKVARRLNLQNGRTESMGSAGGYILITIYDLNELRVGEIRMAQPQIAAADFDLMRSLEIDGILGADQLKAFRVSIDYSKKTVHFERA